MSSFLTPPFIISILIALSVHEWAHAYTANKLGDPTAKMEGRITLNPLSHLDPLGTLMFVFIGFGWGKPVPIDERYFKHRKRDTAITAFAGPLSNLVLAWIAFVGLLMLHGADFDPSATGLLRIEANNNPFHMLMTQICSTSLFINLALMAFNLLPIAPLDGSKVLHPFIPVQYEDTYQQFMRNGPMILLVVIVLTHLIGFPLLSIWVFGIMQPVLDLMFASAQLFL